MQPVLRVRYIGLGGRFAAMACGEGLRPPSARWCGRRRAITTPVIPARPAAIVATIYHALGIDHRAYVTDQQGRPFAIDTGEPVLSLMS